MYAWNKYYKCKSFLAYLQVWYPVTPAMGKSSFDGPECIKEVRLLGIFTNMK